MTRVIIIYFISLICSVQVYSQANFEMIYKPTFGPLCSVDFYNDNLGIVMEDRYIRMTQDGGITWKDKYINGMSAGECIISIQGSDTLFVVAEQEHGRITYFHGFNSSPVEVYKSSRDNWRKYQPSIVVSDSIIIVAGFILDSNNINSTTGIEETAFYISYDHGNSWQLKSLFPKPQNFQYLIKISQVNADTIIATWALNDHPGMYPTTTFASFLYAEYLSTPLFTSNTLWGEVDNCKNGICLISDLQTYDLKILTDAGTAASNVIINDCDAIKEDENDGVFLFEKDEFIAVQNWSYTSSFGSEANTYQIQKNGGSATILDSYLYDDLNDSLYFSTGRVSFSQSQNFIYFTLPPYLVKVKRFELGTSETEFGNEKLTILYNNSNNSIIIDGLDPSSVYSCKLYSIEGRLIKSQIGTVNIGNNRLSANQLPKGTYVVSIQNDNSGSVFTQKIVIY